ncbi:MAG: hypothetical protein MHM6MM_004532 [Cercozoa sp. M6MM]
MSIRLVDLIRKVRACKSAAEERAVIKKESADVRSALKEQSMAVFRQRNIAKLMFIDMLGYPTHFAQMEVINLIASPDFGQKRVGYLALSVLLNESTEVLLLVTQAMQSDLHSNVPYIAGLALSALGCIASADMARDLSADVIEILRSGHPYLCKKVGHVSSPPSTPPTPTMMRPKAKPKNRNSCCHGPCVACVCVYPAPRFMPL